MKKIFMGILSLTILCILSTIACASEPNDQQNGNATPTVGGFRKPQSSEHLMRVQHHVRNYISRGLDSESYEDSFIQEDRSSSDENSSTQDDRNGSDENGSFQIGSTSEEEIRRKIEDLNCHNPSFVSMEFTDSEDEHPLQTLKEKLAYKCKL